MQRRSTAVPAIAWLPYAALSVVHVVALAVDGSIVDATKLALMPCLAIPVIVAARRVRRPAVLALLLAVLLFSWLGDGAAVVLPGIPEVPVMLLLFGIARMCCIVLFARLLGSGRLPGWTLAYAAWWFAMLMVLDSSIGPLFLPVAAYGLVLATMAATAARCGPVIGLGGAALLASDSTLAFRLFLSSVMPDWTNPAVMLFYTLGQGLIVAGVIAAASAAPSAGDDRAVPAPGVRR